MEKEIFGFPLASVLVLGASVFLLYYFYKQNQLMASSAGSGITPLMV
jgi:hypothetical protein